MILLGGIILNINDVAQKAGVSKTTVSRVLLGGDKVKPATKEKVQEAIKSLNYTPNTAAQMLAKKSNQVLGVISTLSITDPFFGYMADQIAVECEKHKYGVLYVPCMGQGKNGCEQEIAMLYGKVDGYIVLGNEHIKIENIEQLVQKDMPVALFKTEFACKGAIKVDIDNVQGGEMAARYLYEKGYRKLGYLHGNNENNDFYEGQERYEGFSGELKKLGIPIAKEFYGDRNFRKAGHLVNKILDSDIDALFCETDLMAYGVINALLEQNIKVPDNLAVLGFDDIRFRNYETNIHLSTVGQPIEQMAACIVGALVNRIENQVPYGDRQLFNTKIVEGRTT